jgi:hypothetical protein
MVWHGMRHATHHQQTSHVTHLMFIKSGCRAARPPMPELTLLPTLANTCRDACYLPSSALRCADLLCAIPSTRRQARAHTHAYTPGTWRQPDASDLGAEGEDATRTRLRGPWPRRLSPIALHPAVFCAFLSAPRGARVHRVSEHSAVWLFFRVLYRFVWLCVALSCFVSLHCACAMCGNLACMAHSALSHGALFHMHHGALFVAALLFTHAPALLVLNVPANVPANVPGLLVPHSCAATSPRTRLHTWLDGRIHAWHGVYLGRTHTR